MQHQHDITIYIEDEAYDATVYVVWLPPEPDVGLMSWYPDDWTIHSIEDEDGNLVIKNSPKWNLLEAKIDHEIAENISCPE